MPVPLSTTNLEHLGLFSLFLTYITTIYINKIVQGAQAMSTLMSTLEDAQTDEHLQDAHLSTLEQSIENAVVNPMEGPKVLKLLGVSTFGYGVRCETN
jgi:hypothetical protein